MGLLESLNGLGGSYSGLLAAVSTVCLVILVLQTLGLLFRQRSGASAGTLGHQILNSQ